MPENEPLSPADRLDTEHEYDAYGLANINLEEAVLNTIAEIVCLCLDEVSHNANTLP